jgi:hypothetical protein
MGTAIAWPRPAACLAVSESRLLPPADAAAWAFRPEMIGLVTLRNLAEDAEIRGVCRNCRMLAYQDTVWAAVQVTRSSLLAVTGWYGRRRPSGPVPRSCRQYA